MKGFVEKMIADYPNMVERREVVKRQLLSLRKGAISVNDIIDSLVYSHPDGERVQTSGISDKTAKIALSYRDLQEKMNEETFSYWMQRYEHLNGEITFLENSIHDLPDSLSEIMEALVIDGMTWDDAEYTLHLNRRTISDRRKEAIEILARNYQVRASEMESYLLS